MNPTASLFRRVVDPEDRPLVASVTIAVSPAELIDKITILEIKAERLADPVKRSNVRTSSISSSPRRRAPCRRRPRSSA